jgi:hypothetical protein
MKINNIMPVYGVIMENGENKDSISVEKELYPYIFIIEYINFTTDDRKVVYTNTFTSETFNYLNSKKDLKKYEITVWRKCEKVANIWYDNFDENKFVLEWKYVKYQCILDEDFQKILYFLSDFLETYYNV